MKPEYLNYAESLATDLDSGNQPVSAGVVRKLLAERADLLAACEAALDLNVDEETSVLQIMAAIERARA